MLHHCAKRDSLPLALNRMRVPSNDRLTPCFPGRLLARLVVLLCGVSTLLVADAARAGVMLVDEAILSIDHSASAMAADSGGQNGPGKNAQSPAEKDGRLLLSMLDSHGRDAQGAGAGSAGVSSGSAPSSALPAAAFEIPPPVLLTRLAGGQTLFFPPPRPSGLFRPPRQLG